MRRRYLLGGLRLRCDIQERIDMSSAEKTEAEFLKRADLMTSLME